jgi:hypothetical protein
MGRQLLQQAEEFVSVACFANNPKVSYLLEDFYHPLAKHLMVIS